MTRGSAAFEVMVPNAAFPSTPLGCPKAGVFAEKQTLAERFLAYMKSAAAGKELSTYGFEVTSQGTK
jgi:hypothetical protein